MINCVKLAGTALILMFSVESVYSHSSNLEKKCKTTGVNFEFAPSNINDQIYTAQVEDYLRTYRCDYDGTDQSYLLESALKLASIGHTFGLVPDVDLGVGFRRNPRLDTLRQEILQEIRSLELEISWRDVEVTPKHFAFIGKFACDLNASLNGAGNDECLMPLASFELSARNLYPRQNIKYVRHYLNNFKE